MLDDVIGRLQIAVYVIAMIYIIVLLFRIGEERNSQDMQLEVDYHIDAERLILNDNYEVYLHTDIIEIVDVNDVIRCEIWMKAESYFPYSEVEQIFRNMANNQSLSITKLCWADSDATIVRFDTTFDDVKAESERIYTSFMELLKRKTDNRDKVLKEVKERISRL